MDNIEEREERILQDNVYNTTNSDTKCHWLSEFLWICAGADRKVLRQCPTDHAKFSGIGGTILFTALMASMSGGYALNSVFDNSAIAVAFGIFWGLLIFNLDRFIVNTMYSDGKVTISWMELASGMPRIIMAVFLGIVISTPLELKIFADEIGITIEEMKQVRERQYVSETESRIDTINSKINMLVEVNDGIRENPSRLFQLQVRTGNENIDRLTAQRKADANALDEEMRILRDLGIRIANLSKQRANLEQNNYKYRKNDDEVKGIEEQIRTLSNFKMSHEKTKAQYLAKISAADRKLAETSDEVSKMLKKGEDEKSDRIAKNNEEVAKLTFERDSLKRLASSSKYAFKSKLDREFNGFQAKMSAFSKMKEDNPTTRLASIFIMLLFIIVETAPTFFKMMIADGPYDDMLRMAAYRAKVLCDKQMSDINDYVNTKVKISVAKNEQRVKSEYDIVKFANDEVAKAQQDIIREAIKVWKEKQIAAAKEKPDDFLSFEESASDFKAEMRGFNCSSTK